MYRRILQLRYRNKRYAILFAVLGLALLFLWLVSVFSPYDYFFSHEKEFEKLIEQVAQRYSIDPLLLKSVIWRESKFRQNAQGRKGEIGLMQVMPSAAVLDWADWNRISPPCRGILFNPSVNIDIGAWYLSRALRKWKDYKNCEALALCEYNAGPGKAKDWAPPSLDGDLISRIGIESTREYVTAIIRKYCEYAEKRKLF
ncbi:MAG: hypothetical protein A2X49_00805 [Lentisphaerae bacterium GWF2_52_8]|nr:MAG: hypothetical protein A2X49_00805 [Lentisphaerae bacterium GWF2_52_8]